MLPEFGDVVLRDLSKVWVLGSLEDKLAQGLSPGTVALYLSFFKHSLTQAVQWGLLKDKPLRGLSLPVKIQNERVRYLLPDEYRRQVEATPLPYKRAIILAVQTGLRRTGLFTLP